MRKRSGGLIVGIVGAGFVAFGFFVGIRLDKPILDKARQTTNWPTVEGKIDSSEVTQRQDRSATDNVGTMYLANVNYSYAVNDKTYKSSSIWSGGKYSSSSSSEQQGIVDRYPPGKAMPVYYDPQHPEQAVLEPGAFFTNYILYVVGWIFLVIGALMLLSIPRTILRRLSGAG